ncbi:transposase, IS4 family protein [Candidatus Thiomargarita nelsonii]|uniref:Transposase, IS4 family protein n=1 Tax=Candidatus Thiomargarita nelsonii TaxID=1003181 RepID=A0A176RW39_9GAMM|nr:transposase, IS4 family protein [Candidatus Thiomargarita nelsonii]
MLEAFKRAFNNNERQMKSLTGLSSDEFSALSETFGKVMDKNRQQTTKNRKRAVGGGKKHSLTLMEKLFVVLFYLKTYPTFDVLGAGFKVDRSTSCRWIHQFLPILEESLGE